jgi:hypothetical protein
MGRLTIIALAGLLAAGTAFAAPRQPPSVAEWIAMTPQQRMALREETRSWTADDRTSFWSRFEAEMKTMSPAERQALADQAAAQMRAATPAPAPVSQPTAPLPKAVALPPPGDLTGQPD